MKITVTKGQNDNADIIHKHNFQLRNEHELHVVVNEIEARDIHSARLVADRRMELVGTMMTLFHHKKHPSWLSECLIIESESQASKFVHKPLNPMHKCIDHKEEKASKKLNKLIHNFSMDHRSLPKFFRSAELHSLALNSESHENQMINLWIALESLVPSSGEKAKIDNIASSIIPFLNLNYINRLLQRLLSDIYNWNNRIIRETLRDIEGTDLKTKVFRLLALEEYQELRTDLNEKFRDFHLLRNRFYYLSNSLNSPRKVKKVIEAHTTRVDWQLRRIYRARNTIVHTGNTPSFTPILIENIHDYLDVVMSTLVNLASEGVEVNSIEQGFKYIELNYLTYLKKLSDAGEQFDSENLEELMFKYSI